MKSHNFIGTLVVLFLVGSIAPLSSQSVVISGKSVSFPLLEPLSENALIFGGRILDLGGSPVSNAVVEIWQTDASGVYNHPGDPRYGSRDGSFQFFGSDTTGSDGIFSFRTLLPGEYRPRPRHIHFKVKLQGQTLLTSQWYFTIPNHESRSDNPNLVIPLLLEGEGSQNYFLGEFDVVLNQGSGQLTRTPSQAEGPFYPVEDPSLRDNDLLDS